MEIQLFAWFFMIGTFIAIVGVLRNLRIWFWDRSVIETIRSIFSTVFSRKIAIIIKSFILDVLLKRRLRTRAFGRGAYKSFFIISYITLIISYHIKAEFFVPQVHELPIYLLFFHSAFVDYYVLRDATPATFTSIDAMFGILNDLLEGVVLSFFVFLLLRRFVFKKIPGPTMFDDVFSDVIVAGWFVARFTAEVATTLAFNTPEPVAKYWFLSHAVASLLKPGPEWITLYNVMWPLSGALLGTFVAYIPYGKLWHIVIGPIVLMKNSVQEGEAQKRLQEQLWVKWPPHNREPKESDQPPSTAGDGGEAVSGPKLRAGQVLELDACMRCTICFEECPVYEENKDVEVTPALKIYNLKRYLQARYGLMSRLLGREWAEKRAEKFKKKLLDNIYKCSVCAQCKINCPVGINTPELWETVRAELVREGAAPTLEKHKMIKTLVKTKYNPYNEPPENRLAWLPPSVKVAERADLGYYVGCTQSYRQTEYAAMTANLLNSLGLEFTLLGTEEYCCGSPLIRTGQIELIRDLVTHNIEKLVAKGVKTVIYGCAGCFRTSVIDWPIYYGKPLSFQPIHITQFLARMIREGRIIIEKPFNETITYHDPCHIGRHIGIYQAPREILKAIPGATYVEMRRSRDHSRCCGAGGGVKSGYPDIALSIAKKRLQDAEEVGATVLTTSCPFCLRNFLDAAEAAKSKIKVMDLTELITQVSRLIGKTQSQ